MHNIFDIITVYTVNHQNEVPENINRIMHILFYIVGILFIATFFHYLMSYSSLYKYLILIKRISYIPLYIFIVILVFLPMEYVKGNGTYYSYEPLAFIGYGIFMIYCIACLFLLIYSWKELEKNVKYSLFPMLLAMCATIIAQAIIPELLLTKTVYDF